MPLEIRPLNEDTPIVENLTLPNNVVDLLEIRKPKSLNPYAAAFVPQNFEQYVDVAEVEPW